MHLALFMINVFERHIDTCVYDFLILISVFFHFQEHIEPPKKTSVVGEGCNNFRCKVSFFHRLLSMHLRQFFADEKTRKNLEKKQISAGGLTKKCNDLAN